jgi:hypothetical protein
MPVQRHVMDHLVEDQATSYLTRQNEQLPSPARGQNNSRADIANAISEATTDQTIWQVVSR